MAYRVPDTSLPENFFIPKTVLTASQLNQVYEILKAGVNANYEDIKRILGVGADGTAADGEFTLQKFNVLASEPEVKEPGMVFYSKTYHTWVFVNDMLQEINLNQETFGVGKNIDGDLYDGQPVYWAGTQGANPVFDKAQAVTGKFELLGVITASADGDGVVTTNEFGSVTRFGMVHKIDLSKCLTADAYSYISGLTVAQRADGNIKLYLSPSEAGKYTHEVPPLPNIVMWVGTLMRAPSMSQADIFIAPTLIRDPSGLATVEQVEELYINNTDYQSRIDILEAMVSNLIDTTIMTTVGNDLKTAVVYLASTDVVSQVTDKINSALLQVGLDMTYLGSDDSIKAVVVNLGFDDHYTYPINGSTMKVVGTWLWAHDLLRPGYSNLYDWRPVQPYAQFVKEQEVALQYEALFSVIDAGTY